MEANRSGKLGLSQAINRRLEDLRPSSEFKDIVSSIQDYGLKLDSSLCLITNYSDAVSQLAQAPIWVSYGGIRTASTFAYNTLRILAGAVAQNVICAWERELASPRSILNLVEASGRDTVGIMKIHRFENDVPSLLAEEKAKAIVTVRDYPSVAKSWWRMVNNSQASTFYRPDRQPEDAVRIIRREIGVERKKRKLANVLFVREDLIRTDTKTATNRIARFLGLKLAPKSWVGLQQTLGFEAMLDRASKVQQHDYLHDKTSFLHPGHVRQSSDQIPGEDIVGELVWKHFKDDLSKDGYLKL
jgi:hypothetical protein